MAQEEPETSQDVNNSTTVPLGENEPHSIYQDNDSYKSNSTKSKQEPEKEIKKASPAKASREKAKGTMCVWHPWRKAYAMCAFCKRPFCFEDITEFKDDYYCLEDIDNMTSTYERRIVSTSRNMAIVAAIMLIFSFLLLSYFEYFQIMVVLGILLNYGIATLLASVNYNYVFVFCEGIFALLGLLAAVFIFLKSKRGIYLGIISCVGSIVILSYRLVSTGISYFGILDAVVFISLVALLYSRITSTLTKGDLRSESSTAKANLENWPNAGKF